ncbi:unnamed protein product [Vitrella brassicaformis CCMP3155]|uniref:RING-type domain-containing protein n=3 Tax=Vitrella brassicaformis TaxID=1169539 RepID=A0A0G4EKU7_VITBC|nr:unnamed protein product [Vitrella brassicaformis CCMP3155]|eukprot:CEL97086.1 unnamed protein product [Vitrella brassicaformis CCMP3155]
MSSSASSPLSIEAPRSTSMPQDEPSQPAPRFSVPLRNQQQLPQPVPPSVPDIPYPHGAQINPVVNAPSGAFSWLFGGGSNRGNNATQNQGAAAAPPGPGPWGDWIPPTYYAGPPPGLAPPPHPPTPMPLANDGLPPPLYPASPYYPYQFADHLRGQWVPVRFSRDTLTLYPSPATTASGHIAWQGRRSRRSLHIGSGQRVGGRGLGGGGGGNDGGDRGDRAMPFREYLQAFLERDERLRETETMGEIIDGEYYPAPAYLRLSGGLTVKELRLNTTIESFTSSRRFKLPRAREETLLSAFHVPYLSPPSPSKEMTPEPSTKPHFADDTDGVAVKGCCLPLGGFTRLGRKGKRKQGEDETRPLQKGMSLSTSATMDEAKGGAEGTGDEGKKAEKPGGWRAAVAIAEEDFFKSSKPKDDEGCAICWCEYEKHSIIRRLNICGHAFHVDCIDQWLEEHHTCPLCRCDLRRPPGLREDTDIADGHARDTPPTYPHRRTVEANPYTWAGGVAYPYGPPTPPARFTSLRDNTTPLFGGQSPRPLAEQEGLSDVDQEAIPMTLDDARLTVDRPPTPSPMRPPFGEVSVASSEVPEREIPEQAG